MTAKIIQLIMEKYHPGEQDKDVYLLQAHKTDSTITPDTTVAQEIKRGLEEVANFKGSRVERLIFLF